MKTSRRSFLAAAAATIPSVSIAENEILTIAQQLDALTTRFAAAARRIDPTIRNVWVLKAGEQADMPCYIHIDREDGVAGRIVA